jgi:hypothetical protein
MKEEIVIRGRVNGEFRGLWEFGMMTSELVMPDGKIVESEASHGAYFPPCLPSYLVLTR